MATKETYTELITWPLLDINAWTKISIRKVLVGDKPFIDVRVMQKFLNKEEFLRTKKGIFAPELEWKNKILPYLNEIFNNGNT